MKQLYINENSKLEAVSLNEVNTSSLPSISISKTMPLIIGFSRRTFTNDFIVEKVGYSRQTVSYIHNNRYSQKQAIKYIRTMLPLLVAIGFTKNSLIERVK